MIGREAMRPLRILMTARPGRPSWSFALELARGLGAYPAELTLAACSPLDAEARSALRGIANMDVLERSVWEDSAGLGEWLLGLEEALAPDLVHLDDCGLAILPWRGPVMASIHAVPPSVLDGPVPGLSSVDLVMTPNRSVAAALRGHLAGTELRISFPGRLALPQAMPQKEPTILSVGDWASPEDNLDLLDRIAPRLSWPVMVAGPCRTATGGPVRSDSLSVLGNLPASRLEAWHGRAALYVCPARREPFGFSIIDAALHGCALVLSDLPGLREVWGGAALFVPPDDTDCFVSAIETLIADQPLRQAMGQAARVRAGGYSARDMAQDYWGAYRSLAAGHSPQSRATPIAPLRQDVASDAARV